MSIPASPFLPALIHVRRHADNGFSPDSAFYSQITGAMAHIVAYRRKCVYRRVCKLGEPGGIPGPWRWHCRAGWGAERFVVYAVLALDDRNIAVDPYISVAITKVSGPTTTTMEFHGGESRRAATDAPEEFIPFLQTMDVVAGEIYTGVVSYNNNVRVVALMVWEDSAPEIDDANHPHSEWSPSAGSPILDGDIGNELDGVGDLIRYNGGLRWDWQLVDGTARVRTSATVINLIDNSSASPPTAATPGVVFVTTARCTIGTPTVVRVKMAVYASIGAGSGTVRLRDTAGTDGVTVTVNATAQWFTNTGTISVGTGQKYDLMFDSDGANLMSVYAVSVYEEG